MSRSLFNYESSKKEDPKVINAILELKEKHPYYGVPRVLACLRRRGFVVNGKKVYRIIKIMKLGVQKKRRWHRPYLPVRNRIPQAQHVGDVWAMDFVSDKFTNGESFRCLTIIDTLSREVPGMLVRKSMALHAPLKFLDSFRMKNKLPNHIVVDNGSEFANKAFVSWCEANKIGLHFIDPGKPVQNGYIESFNGKFRDEFLSRNQFENIHHISFYVKKWIDFYNNERPHKSLDYLTPKEFADQQQMMLENRNQPVLKTG